MMDFIYENQQRDLEQRIRQLERRYLATLREHPDTDDRAVNLVQIEAEHAELVQAKASIVAIDTPATAPEEQIEQAAQARAAEIVKQQKIEDRAQELIAEHGDSVISMIAEAKRQNTATAHKPTEPTAAPTETPTNPTFEPAVAGDERQSLISRIIG